MASLLSPSCRYSLTPPLAQFRSISSRARASQTQTRVRLRSTMSRATPEDTAAGGGAVEEKQEDDVIVQYVVLRRDLIDTWPLGSVVTQGCHASVSAVWEHRDDPLTVAYCSPEKIDSMHKLIDIPCNAVTLPRTRKDEAAAVTSLVTLEVKGEPQILNLAEKLKAAGIAHKLWIEQPENIPTCLATKPCAKSTVSLYFKKLKLCK